MKVISIPLTYAVQGFFPEVPDAKIKKTVNNQQGVSKLDL